MASCDWKKIKGPGEAKAMFRHCDNEKRLELNHTNEQINKSYTHLNMTFGEFKNGYENVCKAYDNFISDLDSVQGANKRKDRVTLVGWSVPVPEGMDEHTARNWIADVYQLMVDEYGNRLLGGSAHFDEMHEYIDAEKGMKRKSRPHLHMYAVPVVDGKLNAKQFMARQNMVNVNNMIEEMTQSNYHGYKFQTGTKKKSRRSVEELKNESALREAFEEVEKEAGELYAQSQAIADDIEIDAAELLSYAEEVLDSAVAYAKSTNEASKRDLSLAKKQIDEIIAKANKIAQKVENRAQKINEELKSDRELIERMKSELSDVYNAMLREKQYFEQARTDYGLACVHIGLGKAEEYMKKRLVKYKDGRSETIYDGYKREVLDKQAERVAKWENPESLKQHSNNAQNIRRKLSDLNIVIPDDIKNDNDFSL